MGELQRRITARLNEVLDLQQAAGFEACGDRGLGQFDAGGYGGVCMLSVDDVARIAAEEAERFADEQYRQGFAEGYED